MGPQQGVAESGRHLPWATAICNNHDQSSDPSAGSPVMSLLEEEALLFWACSYPWQALRAVTLEDGGSRGGQWRGGGTGPRACDRGICTTYWSVKRDIHPLRSYLHTTVWHLMMNDFLLCTLEVFLLTLFEKIVIYILHMQRFVLLSLT